MEAIIGYLIFLAIIGVLFFLNHKNRKQAGNTHTR